MKTKKYKLLKDLPNFKAGAIFEAINFVRSQGEDKIIYYSYNSGCIPIGLEYPVELIENSPEWFEEIKEENKEIKFNGFDTNNIEELVKVLSEFTICLKKFNNNVSL